MYFLSDEGSSLDFSGGLGFYLSSHIASNYEEEILKIVVKCI